MRTTTAGAVLVVGPASAGRSDLFSDVEEEGADTTTGGNGVVAQAAGGLFNALRRKSKSINGTPTVHFEIRCTHVRFRRLLLGLLAAHLCGLRLHFLVAVSPSL